MGSGSTELAGRDLAWSEGDVLVLPTGALARHRASTATVFYPVDDSPLLAYLGATATTPRFAPTRFPAGGVAGEAGRGRGRARRGHAQAA